LMSGCSISRICGNELARGVDSGIYCSPFSVMADTCVNMMGMSGCQALKALCSNGSLVAQCKTPVLPFPSDAQLRSNLKSICTEMWMNGCDACIDEGTGGFKLCDKFLVYSTLCEEMPTMAQCAAYHYYCAYVPRWDLCGGGPGSNLPPEMRMYWHFSIADYVLFKEWVPRTTFMYIVTLAACFLFAVMYECLKACIGFLENRWRTDLAVGSISGDVQTEKESLLGATAAVSFEVPPFDCRRDSLRGALHLIYIGLHYWIMLIAMTYNVGLFLAVLLGHGFAYMIVNRYHRLTRKDNSCCST